MRQRRTAGDEHVLEHGSRVRAQTHAHFDEHAACSRWMEWMTLGEFERAWKESDRIARHCTPGGDRHLPLHLRRVWDGTPLEGRRVLVRCYHGLGDTIQFIRYIPLLKTIAATVSLQCQSRLAPLLRHAAGVEEMTSIDAPGPEPRPFEVDIEVMELAYAFRTTLASIPSDVPYIRLPDDLAKGQQVDRKAGSIKAGLVWSSGDWNPRRSVPLSKLEPLFELSGIEWFSLQRGPASDDVIRSANLPITQLEREKSTIVDTAAWLLDLDLTITVDTMTAHLAGALARPVWTLLPSPCDWRWMTAREDSPWYPTMRLFRQTRSGEWDNVIERVAATLRDLEFETQSREERSVTKRSRLAA